MDFYPGTASRGEALNQPLEEKEALNQSVGEAQLYEFEAWNSDQTVDARPDAIRINIAEDIEQPEFVPAEEKRTGFIERTKNKAAILAISTTGLLLGGNALANADDTERASGPDATASATKTTAPTAATYNYVEKGKIPLGKEFLKSFRHAKRSEKQTQRHTTGIDTDYSNLTKLTFDIAARVAGDRSSRGKAYYHSDAFFRGSIKPKNLVEMYIDKGAEAHRYTDRNMIFGMGTTTRPGPTGIVTSRLWTIDAWTKGSGGDQYDSCTVKGDRGYHPVLSSAILNAGLQEARKTLRQAKNRRPLKRQKNVFAGMKSAKEC